LQDQDLHVHRRYKIHWNYIAKKKILTVIKKEVSDVKIQLKSI